MDSRTKVAYGLAVSSLAIGILCTKATVDRIATGHALAATEKAVLALAILETSCGVDAGIDWIEDEFADAMQDHGKWCQGSVVQAIADWDSGHSYQFRGHASIGPGISFHWSRLPELTSAQKSIKLKLEKAAEEAATSSSAPVSFELLRFEQELPLLRSHDLWFASGHVVNLNFGERAIEANWSAIVPEGKMDFESAQTASFLREYVLKRGSEGSVSGKDPESVYRALLSNWSNQSIKVPLLNVELKYDYAVIALAAAALLQLLWLARALGGAKIDDDPQLYARLSLQRQITDATSAGSGAKVVAFFDWLSLLACGALSLSAPILCFVCAFVAYRLAETERTSMYFTAAFATASVALSIYILRRLHLLLVAVRQRAASAA